VVTGSQVKLLGLKLNNKNKNKGDVEFMGEVIKEADIDELLKEAMRQQGYTTFIDTDGIEKDL
jgi:hypothetical protein